MKPKAVETSQDQYDFLEVASTIYQNDLNWIRPLDRDIEAVFDPQKNKKYHNRKKQQTSIKQQKTKTRKQTTKTQKRTQNKKQNKHYSTTQTCKA